MNQNKIRQQANRLAVAAMVLAIFSGLLMLAGALGGFSQFLWTGVAAFFTALWIYLIAQIVHIRANTEK